MKLNDLMAQLGLTPVHLADGDTEVAGAYCGDLLSDVLAHARPRAIWFTIQGHVNVVAVAQLRDLACIALVNGVAPDPQTVAKSRALGVNLVGSEATSAALCARLAGLGLPELGA